MSFSRSATKRAFSIICAGWLLLSAACAQPEASLPRTEAGFDEATIAQADAAIQQFIDAQQLAGVVALVARRGEVFYHKAFGMQDLEHDRPMARNSSFQIASMTKPISTVALLILMEEGKVRLDDPVSAYLPAYANLRVAAGNGQTVPLETPLTLRHCLMHTGGLLSPGHPLAGVDDSKLHSVAEYVDVMARAPLAHQPGARFSYGRTSTNVIARIVEVVTGQAFEEYIKARIFTPLNMHDTYYTLPEEALSRFSSIYRTGPNGLQLVQGPTTKPEPYPMGSRGLSSTAHDYFRFAQMLLNGGELDGKRILKPESVALMTTDSLPRALFPLRLGPLVFDQVGFGIGLAVVNGDPAAWQPKPLTFAHSMNLPAGSYIWPGVFNTFWWVDPAHEIVGVVLSQNADAQKPDVFQAFHHALYRGLYGIDEEAASSSK